MVEVMDTVNFGLSVFFSVVIWGIGVAAIIFYYVKTNSRNYFHTGFPELPTSIVVTLALVIAWVGALPILNAMADQAQYGSLVGASRDILSDEYRPLYGRGWFQFLVSVLIIVAGGFVAYLRRENRY